MTRYYLGRQQWKSTLLACLTFCTISAWTCSHQAVASAAEPATAAGSATQRTENAFNQVKANPLELRAFLLDMPKGGDLHLHLSGGTVYSETLIRDAAEDDMCVLPPTMVLSTPVSPKGASAQPECDGGRIPAESALHDQKLYDAMVNAYSMRSFVPTSGTSGHDQFFSTFDRFIAISPSHVGEWVNEIATRGVQQNEQYIEAMYTPTFSNAAKLGAQIGWKGDSDADIARTRDELLARGLRDEVPVDRKDFDAIDASRAAIEHCGQPNAAPACGLQVRYLYQVLRGFPPQQVFAQTLLGFEVASVDPRVVGLNFVMPEDSYLSMRDYHLHMRMLHMLHQLYPKVRITLHAGELAPGLVPPDGLHFHIREAVELAGAERIGHGVDVMYEDHPHELLKELADRHIMIEINLTSNDVILGIKGKDNPLAEYRAAHVPVALSTDDEGVSRIDLTHEYVKAVEEQGLGYLDLKQMARTSLEHAFLPGISLWAAPDNFSRRNQACAGAIPPSSSPSAACSALLQASPRAQQQYELERRFTVFESTH